MFSVSSSLKERSVLKILSSDLVVSKTFKFGLPPLFNKIHSFKSLGISILCVFSKYDIKPHDVYESNDSCNKPGERHKKDVGSEFNKAKDKRTSTQ